MGHDALCGLDLGGGEQIREPDEGVFAVALELDEASIEALGEQLAQPQLGAAGRSAVGVRMMQIAWGQRGVCESGQNAGEPLRRYVHPFLPRSGPLPWCAFFVSWCYLQTTNRKPPWTNPGYVPSVHGWASQHGKVVRVPLKGDMFGIGGDHMGIVVQSTRRPQRFVTIEGNTSSGCVRSLERPWAGHWFARI
ncbi:MAG: hypothetical protein M3406_12415 [Chloroflexota bacterium]|nr:hypothetical protein [Chloroflexota bacterium]